MKKKKTTPKEKTLSEKQDTVSWGILNDGNLTPMENEGNKSVNKTRNAKK